MISDVTASQFDHFAAQIASLPAPANGSSYSKQELRLPQFQLYAESRLEIYYAPFDYVNTAAEVVLVGITPGSYQMERSFNEARRGLLQALPHNEVQRRAKEAASFS